MLFKKKCFNMERSKGNFCVRKSKEIASLIKMRSTLEVPKCSTKGILAIICSNSFSHCKVDQKKIVGISHMFNHVQLHEHWMHFINTRICRYITPTVQAILHNCDQNRCVNEVVQP